MMGWFRSVLSAALLLCVLGVGLCGCVAARTTPLDDAGAAYNPGDYVEAAKFYRPLADQGDASAQNFLGSIYSSGQGVPQDYTEAARWYRLAAAQGDTAGQFNLGMMYYNGQGVPQDYAEAVKWNRLAAAQGNVVAQLALGVMYYNGKAVPQDYVSAHMWFNLAASRSPASDKYVRDTAVKQRDLVAAKMTPAQIAEAQRRAREWKPK